MSCQFLDGPRGGSLHRQVRTERVPKNMHALIDPRDTLSPPDGFNHAVARDRRSIRETQDPIGSEMPSGLERRCEAL